jgi:hypothetical protein
MIPDYELGFSVLAAGAHAGSSVQAVRSTIVDVFVGLYTLDECCCPADMDTSIPRTKPLLDSKPRCLSTARLTLRLIQRSILLSLLQLMAALV